MYAQTEGTVRSGHDHQDKERDCRRQRELGQIHLPEDARQAQGDADPNAHNDQQPQPSLLRTEPVQRRSAGTGWR